MDQDTENKPEIDTESLYQLLDLTKQATTQQIKKAFRRKAIKQHPDKGGDPEKFRQIKEASEILSNPETRQLYDQYGMEGVKAGGDPNGGGDFMSMFFKGGANKQRGPKKCKPKLIPVPVTLEKVYEGGSVNIEVERLRPCDKCEGQGGTNSKTCPGCNGQRVIEKLVNLGRGMYTQTMAPCDKCEGQGVLFEEGDRCKQCQGKRILPNKKKFDIPIDPGVPHEHDYVMSGEADEYPGALAGDVYFRILIEDHPEFVRKGADILYVKKISLLEALTGVCFDLKLLDGSTIKIATPKGVIISNDQKKVIKRKGMPFYKDPMSKGNLIILFQVQFPENNKIDKVEYKSLADIFNQSLNTEAQVQEPQSNYLEDPANQKDEDWEDEEEEGEQNKQGGVVCQPQ